MQRARTEDGVHPPYQVSEQEGDAGERVDALDREPECRRLHAVGERRPLGEVRHRELGIGRGLPVEALDARGGLVVANERHAQRVRDGRTRQVVVCGPDAAGHHHDLRHLTQPVKLLSDRVGVVRRDNLTREAQAALAQVGDQERTVLVHDLPTENLVADQEQRNCGRHPPSLAIEPRPKPEEPGTGLSLWRSRRTPAKGDPARVNLVPGSVSLLDSPRARVRDPRLPAAAGFRASR